jgi:hypothetical protein
MPLTEQKTSRPSLINDAFEPKSNDEHFGWSEAEWWAWEDLNLRLHPETKIVRTNGSAAPSRAWPGTPDSHPSWRPPAMGVLSGIEG